MRGKRSFFTRTGQVALILILALGGLFPAAAEELTDEDKALPVWVLMEKGISAFREGDFATALTL
ncbi:MAG: hypothetical protein JXA95_07700, partial [Spirochaetales bacterium]|nr:hypothetical protein [Spirochaetales bacterium]